MSEYEEFEQILKVRKTLTSTKTSILTPNLGKGFHLMCSYHRFHFIAKVIEYMVYMKSTYGIEDVSGRIILDAVCEHSWYLKLVPSYKQLELLLIEISAGLGLLDVEELGTVNMPNPMYHIDKSQEAEIKTFLGYKFKLSHKGWEAYKKQEYQILAANLFAARLSRCVSYIAVVIALSSLLIRCSD